MSPVPPGPLALNALGAGASGGPDAAPATGGGAGDPQEAGSGVWFGNFGCSRRPLPSSFPAGLPGPYRAFPWTGEISISLGAERTCMWKKSKLY